EKAFLARHGVPHVAFRHVEDAAGLAAAVAAIGAPCVVKTAGFGYDGKGQQLVSGADDSAALAAAERLAAKGPVVVERQVDLALELSVVGARTAGEERVFGPIVNRHSQHILDLSFTPHISPGGHGSAEEYVLD